MARDKITETRRRIQDRGFVPVTVDGGCMRPTLEKGEVVLIHRASVPRVGDVVLLNASGWLEIHRLISRIRAGPRSWYVHMGDATSLCGLAGTEDVLGVIRVDVPRRRAPARYAHALTLVLRLAAVFWTLGLHPGRRGAGSLAGGIKRILSFLFRS